LLFSLTLATLSILTCTLLGDATRFFRRLLPRLLFFGATKVFGLNPLALAALVLNALGLETRGFFNLAALRIDFVLLLTSLLFENVALDVRPLPAHFDIHGASTTLRACQLEFALRLALERYLARRRISVVSAPVAAPQVRKQFELRIIADAVVGSFHFDTRLVELHEQPVNRHLEDFCKLRNCYFCHRY
jgi:hypothetical protein